MTYKSIPVFTIIKQSPFVTLVLLLLSCDFDLDINPIGGSGNGSETAQEDHYVSEELIAGDYNGSIDYYDKDEKIIPGLSSNDYNTSIIRNYQLSFTASFDPSFIYKIEDLNFHIARSPYPTTVLIDDGQPFGNWERYRNDQGGYFAMDTAGASDTLLCQFRMMSTDPDSLYYLIVRGNRAIN